jgi:2-oxoglutarate ferredoxin oxidoreductase subunit alpha
LLFAVEHQVDTVLNLIQSKFGKKQQVFDAMTKTLKMGFYYAETIEFSLSFVNEIPKLEFEKGLYRNIQGNTAVALAIVASRWIFDKTVFFGGYPITPASDILHELVKHNYEGIEIMQAEDEIAAVSMAIGASYGGAIGVTASSGPGIDLKQEAISLAQSAELPLLIIDVMRAGPSTGMPTKLEQSDLETVYYGRHGESPVPIVAIKSPSTAFETTLKAIEIMIKFQTPVFLLSDVSIANGSESWKIPNLTKINIQNSQEVNPFYRNENLVKPWIKPGTPDRQFIIGGLEKNSENGGISYEPKNHEVMTQIRSQKVQNIAKEIPQLELDTEIKNTKTLIISWGSTYGSVKSAVKIFNESEKDTPISHLHLEWIHPFPSNFDLIISRFDQIAVAELNAGQLANIIASRMGKPIIKINKIQGIPFLTNELIDAFKKIK